MGLPRISLGECKGMHRSCYSFEPGVECLRGAAVCLPRCDALRKKREGQMAAIAPNPIPVAQDFLPLKGTDHIEFYVGNARQAAYFYRAAFGMSLVAYAGPETGRRDRASYVLQQGKIRFVLTTPLRDGQSDRAAYCEAW